MDGGLPLVPAATRTSFCVGASRIAQPLEEAVVATARNLKLDEVFHFAFNGLASLLPPSLRESALEHPDVALVPEFFGTAAAQRVLAPQSVPPHFKCLPQHRVGRELRVMDQGAFTQLVSIAQMLQKL